MGIYADQVFPRLMDLLMDTKETRRIRTEVCAPLHGTVLEIGFGSGHNLPFMPSAVDRLVAVDPMRKGQDLARARIAARGLPVDVVGLDGQRLPLEDASVDWVLSTWTLCSIPDPVAAVSEVRRVLEPGGAFHFAEHGLAPEAGVQRWQHRLDGVQRKVACGCTLTRDIGEVVGRGGMVIQDLETYYANGEPKLLGWTYQGRASAA